jgi:hypothetical protein
VWCGHEHRPCGGGVDFRGWDGEAVGVEEPVAQAALAAEDVQAQLVLRRKVIVTMMFFEIGSY